MDSTKAVRRLFLLPAVLLILALSIFPLIFSLALSFGSWDAQVGAAYQWEGLANYARLVRDSRYLTSFVNTGLYVGASVSLQFALGLGLAWLLYQQPPGRRFFQIAFLLPMMLAPVAVGYMWKLLFQTRIGPINFALSGLGFELITWLSQRSTALVALIVVETWQWTPFIFLFLYAAFRSLPRDPIEAALVDGAGPWQVFRHIMLPMIRPIAIAVVLLRAVETWKIIDTVFVMTGGGPGDSTQSLTLYAYRVGLRFFDLGYASAIAYTILIGVVVLALPIILFVKKDAEII